MPHEIYRHEIQVPNSKIDIMGHVNNVAYVEWMQEIAFAHSAANGWDWARYQELGAAWVARAHQIEYYRPAFLDDRILAETWVSEMKRVSSTRMYRFVDKGSGVILAEASTRWALISLSGSVPLRIPQEMADSFVIIEHREGGEG